MLQNLTAKRMSLSPRKLEDLTIISENKDILDLFGEKLKLDLSKKGKSALDKIRMEVLAAGSRSDTYEEDESEDSESVDIDELLMSDED